MKKKSSYARAGVDIDEMMQSLASVKRMVKQTARPEVLNDIGAFGGLFSAPGREWALVASTDGVGTKLKVAVICGRHKTVGRDLVNHCVNDILVQGAEPLFFLDYIGTANLEGRVFRDIVFGLCRGCRENGCALLGGETAEMPGLYPRGEYDLVGTIVGAVRKSRIITGADIKSGDVVIGLPSSGLHTNGYSLARRVIFETAELGPDDIFPGTRRRVGDVLLTVHRSYLKPVRELMAGVKVRGMAHITGGGLIDNVPRILPRDLTAEIDTSSWKVPAVFRFIAETGRVDAEEMLRVFNMGIGFVIIVRARDTEKSQQILRASGEKPRVIGRIVDGNGGVVLR